uniref:mediator of RNA polymerase II transcription subunit 13 isoform X9 n=1 Tax=Anopheles coluzzii TaxID=1518534 RepID=UPI0020FFB78F|nr:mediator of RNA polymerase II transcription subunit 13 isoform X9 [Anopheles coluzzii]
MDIGMDRSGTDAGMATIGSLFQHIVNEMKNSSPLWEDFIAKATKLHACLRAAIQALAAYLDAFQKIADAATNSRGATKEIGTALTRVCLRHKAVESRMKTFTTAIMDCLVVPLQEKLEDWKKQVTVIDKDHAKEYKRCRAELKKRSSDTLRLQKKAKKGAADNLHVLVESSMQDVTMRRCELEEVERKSLRAIMVEERTRYCTFVNMLQPVVHEECEVMSELGHLQEAMQLIAIVTKDPAQLPQASEELILESKANISLYPDSPGGSNSQGGCSNSLGSRKSSVCSISSINSSSSGSPGHHQFQRSLSQYSPAIRLKPGESSDSGFCSSPALTSQASTLASQSHAVSTWPPHTQDATSTVDRPHTISSAYEKGHQRPALTVYTFQSPETIAETQKSPANVACRPPLPVRCSSLERPLSTTSVKNANPNVPRQCPSPIPAHITKEHPQLQPTYVNMTELASMAASKTTNNSNNVNNNNNNNNHHTSTSGNNGGASANNVQQAASLQSHSQIPYQQQQQQQQQLHSPVLSSASSLISPDSNATNAISSPDVSACSTQTPQNTPQTGSPGTPNYSSIGCAGGGTINLGFRSTTPSSAGGGTAAVTPSESNIDTSSNHTITIDDNEEHFNNTISTTSASANITSTTTISTSDTSNNSSSNNTTTNTTTTATSSTNKPSPPHCSTVGGTADAPPKSVLDKDKDILKRTGSVLEKTSLFEQQINNNQLHQPTVPPPQQQQLSVPTSPATLSTRHNDPNALYGRRTNEEIYKSAGQLLLDRDAGPTRVTRRASVNTVKPPPPVRRSSSVTPSPSVGTNSTNTTNTTNLAQQSLAYTSSESLPPPPAYLLDSAAGSSPSISGNVAGTVKALNEIRHTPASPGVLRRAQQQSNPPSNQGSPTQYTNQYGTLPANRQHGHDHIASTTSSLPPTAPTAAAVTAPQSHYPPSQHHHHHHPSTPNSFHATDSNKPLSNRSPKTNLHQQGGIYAQPKQLSTMSSFRTSSPGPQKPNSSFLAQLNAKIAPNKTPQSQSPVPYQQSQQQQQQQANNYGYTTAQSGNELIYQRSTPVDPRAYNNNQQHLQQQQQQQQQQQYYQQHQQQQQPPPHPPREGKHSIYSTSNQPTSQQHYQQQQQLHQQQQQYYQTQYQSQQQQPHQPLQYQQQPQSSPYYYQQQQQQQSQQAPHKQHQPQPQYGHVLPPAGATSSSGNSSSSAGGYPTQNIYVSTNPFVSSVQTSSGSGSGMPVGSYSPSSFGKGTRHHHDDGASGGGASGSSTPSRTNHHSRNSSANNNGAAGGSSGSASGPTHNVLAKTSAGFLENLNARLAEQRLSGKAFAVRNLINSKALPDPRICHESLMDQIKRGATLKRNRTINDRSAPKIH